MRNPKDAGLWLDFCAGKLDPERSALLSRHLEQCQDCRQAVQAQRRVYEAMGGWLAAPVSADFNRRLYRRLDEEASRGWWPRLFPAALRPAMPVAAACLVLVAAVLLRAPEPVVPDTKLSVESIDLDQLERTLDDLEMLRQLGVALPEEPSPGKAL